MEGLRFRAATPRRFTRRAVLATAAGLTAAVLTARPPRDFGGQDASPIPVGGTPTAGEEVAFALSGGVTTHGVFTIPVGGTPPYPAVLLIAGAGITDRDEAIAEPDGTFSRPFAQIAEELTARGIVVFRYDKRGVCPTAQLCDPAAYATQTKEILIEDAGLAYAQMLTNPLVDPDRTGLLGHSDGTWYVPGVVDRHPAIGAVVLIGTGLGRADVLRTTTVDLPLLGLARFDANDDGAIDPTELPFADPAALGQMLQLIRTPGQLFLLRYEGSCADQRPVGLNLKLDTNGDGKLDLVSEVRPVYEALYGQLPAPLPLIERYVDPGLLPMVVPLFQQSGALEGALEASFQGEPADQHLRALLAMPSRPPLLIVNGENDDQTPASSAQQLADGLARADYPATLRIYPGLGHVLSPQADIYAPYSAVMAAEPLADIGTWLADTLLLDAGTPLA